MAKRNNKMLPRTFAVMLSVNVMASLLSVPALASGENAGGIITDPVIETYTVPGDSGNGGNSEAGTDGAGAIGGDESSTGGSREAGTDGAGAVGGDEGSSGGSREAGTDGITEIADSSTGNNADESADGTGGSVDAGTGSSISGNEDGATGTADSSTGSIADESEGSTDGSIESSDETTGDAGSSAGNSTEASTDGAAENEKYPEQSETVSTADVVFNQETGKFEVTFRVDEAAEGDQTFVLSDVMNIINQKGTDKAAQDKDTQEWIEEELSWVRYGGEVCKRRCTYDGVEYIITLAPADNEAGYSQTVSLYQEPGCTTAFDVILSNGSKHTYAYKEGSLNVSTPDLSGAASDSGVIGFDGQALPEKYQGDSDFELHFSKDKDQEPGCMETLVDSALQEFGEEMIVNQYLDKDGNLTTDRQKTTVEAGTSLVKIGNYYYVRSGDYYYGRFSKNAVLKDAEGNYTLKEDSTNKDVLAYDSKGSKVSTYIKPDRTVNGLMNREIQDALDKYMSAYGYESYDDYILDYYKKPDGSRYESVSELLRNDVNALNDLGKSGTSMPGNDNTVGSDPAIQYDRFYQHIMGFQVGDAEDMDALLGNMDHEHAHGEWASNDPSLSIGSYMTDKLDETEGAWDKANQYFNDLTAAGVSSDKATWVAFTMAINLDGRNMNNDYQNTSWEYYNSIVMDQIDGEFELIKQDAQGSVIGDEEGESQTEF